MSTEFNPCFFPSSLIFVSLQNNEVLRAEMCKGKQNAHTIFNNWGGEVMTEFYLEGSKFSLYDIKHING